MKQLASNYSISGSTVTLTGVNVPLSQILLISDATTGNVLYSMAGPAAASYTQGTNSTLTLATAPGSSDKLTVYYDDGVAPTNAPTSVSVSSLPLPTGAAQDGTDGTGITAPTGGSGIRGWLSGIYSKLSSALSVSQSGTWSIGRTWTLASANDSVTIQGGNSAAVKVDGSGVTQPVSIADGSDTAEGSKADSAATNSTSSWSVIALLKGLYAALTGTPSVGAVSATNTVSTTGIVPSAGNLLINSTDVSAYRSVTIQTTYSGGGGGAYQAQVSPDGTNWIYISGQTSTLSSSGSTTSAYVSGASYYTIGGTLTTFSLVGVRYFRAYVTGGSGTGTVNTTAFFSSLPVQPTLVQDSSNNLLVAGTVTANTSPATTYSYNNTGAISASTVIIGPIDCSSFKELTLHSVAVGTGGTGFTVQISNDNSNYITLAVGSGAAGTGAAGLFGTSTQASGFIICYPTYGAKYARIITNGTITAGTTTAYAQLSQIPTTKTFVNATLSANTPSPAPSTAQGFATYFTLVSAAGTNATSVKASAGTIGTCVLTNTTASVKFVKVFNKASAPTMGTDTPVIQFPISANSTLDVSSSFAGLRLSTGIALATTGGSALLDNTSVAAGDVLVNMTYV